MNQISFYDELLPAVLSGDKTITIRRASGVQYQVGSQVNVISHSNSQTVGMIEITAIEAIRFQDINQSHARREQMSLPVLKQLINKIYPNNEQLTVISFKPVQ